MRLAAASNRKFTFTKVLLLAVCVLCLLVLAGAILLHVYWPFSESAVRKSLAESTSADVTFTKFHDRHFPPGCVVEGVSFRRDGAAVPLLTIQRLRISSNLVGLLHHHISWIQAEGLRMNWAGWREARAQSSSRPTVVDRLTANDALLEIPHDGKEPLRFAFHQFEIRNLRGAGETTFVAAFENPLPPGRLRTSGKFGPWNEAHPADTAVKGQYSLEHADLAVFDSISGFVTSTGAFSGTFRQIEIQGNTDTPLLTATKTHHGLPLRTDFSAAVNSTTGDVLLHKVKAQFGKDDLTLHGSIARDREKKRVAILDIRCDHGRVEDTFYPFIHSPKPGLAGNIQFQMRVTIPSGMEPFQQKVGLESVFRIDNAQFTHYSTQLNLSKIAETPGQREPDPAIPANLQGKVSLHNGVAQFAELAIEDQGAEARFRGKYRITDERVDLHGQLKTEASLTKTTHGIKAVFAKVLEPFFKKRPHVTVVPVKIGGTYTHPAFGLDTG